MGRVRLTVDPGCPAPGAAHSSSEKTSHNPFLSHAFLAALGSVEIDQGLVPAGRSSICWSTLPTARSLPRRPAYLPRATRAASMSARRLGGGLAHAGGNYYPELAGRGTVHAGNRPPAPGAARSARGRRAPSSGRRARRAFRRRRRVQRTRYTFATEDEYRFLGELGFLQRTDQQFHWENAGYGSFDDFLGALASRKRKTIRRERQEALQNGMDGKDGSPAAISPRTCGITSSPSTWRPARANGAAQYLTRPFFSLIGETMRETASFW